VGELDEAFKRRAQERAEAEAWGASPVHRDWPVFARRDVDLQALIDDFATRVRSWDAIWVGTGPDGADRAVYPAALVSQSEAKGGAWSPRRREGKEAIRTRLRLHELGCREERGVDVAGLWILADCRVAFQFVVPMPTPALAREFAEWLTQRGWA
jgi:hypothetical protein